MCLQIYGKVKARETMQQDTERPNTRGPGQVRARLGPKTLRRTLNSGLTEKNRDTVSKGLDLLSNNTKWQPGTMNRLHKLKVEDKLKRSGV